jgi:hypothetical protein
VKEKKQQLERRSNSVCALSMNGRRLNKHRMPLVIYRMRLMMKGRNGILER